MPDKEFNRRARNLFTSKLSQKPHFQEIAQDPGFYGISAIRTALENVRDMLQLKGTKFDIFLNNEMILSRFELLNIKGKSRETDKLPKEIRLALMVGEGEILPSPSLAMGNMRKPVRPLQTIPVKIANVKQKALPVNVPSPYNLGNVILTGIRRYRPESIQEESEEPEVHLERDETLTPWDEYKETWIELSGYIWQGTREFFDFYKKLIFKDKKKAIARAVPTIRPDLNDGQEEEEE